MRQNDSPNDMQNDSANARTLNADPVSRLFRPLSTLHTVLRLAAAIAVGTIAWAQWQARDTPLASHHSHLSATSGQAVLTPNPWRGLPGCLWLTDDVVRTGVKEPLWSLTPGDNLGCGLAMTQEMWGEGALSRSAHTVAARNANAAAIPPQMGSFLNDLRPLLAAPAQSRPRLTMPTTSRAEAQSPTGVVVNGHPTTQGVHISATVTARDQTLAQGLVSCMTGHLDDCAAADVPATRWQHHYEAAAARMATLVQIDVATGAIEALASAHTPCYDADARGAPLPAPGIQASANASGTPCPVIAHAPRVPALWRLDNHALYAQEKPGSLVKIVLALALLRSDLGPYLLRNPDKLARAFKESDTPQFLDWLYCKDDKKEAYSANCQRHTHLPQAARDLGLDGAKLNLLQGDDESLGPKVPGARLFQTLAPVAQTSPVRLAWQTMPMAATPSALRTACAKRGWSACDGEALAAQTAEIWGAGSATASPVAIASAFARLAQAANGHENENAVTATRVHLLTRGFPWDVDDATEAQAPAQSDKGQSQASGNHAVIAQGHAAAIQQALGYAHHSANALSKVGTAHSACVAVYGSAKACNGIAFVRTKTGTPGFKHDTLTLSARAALCTHARAQAAPLAKDRWPPALRVVLNQCAATPVKWFAALFSSTGRTGDAPDKAIVVLTERNFDARTGRVDSPLDRVNPNIAAELGFRYIKARVSAQP